MTLCLCESLNESIKTGLNIDNLADWLRTVANSCCVEALKQTNNSLKLLRVMTGCCLIYDSVIPIGAFNPKGKFNMIECVRALQSFDQEEVTLLINSIKYASKHFNDDDTPKNIKVLLL